MKSGESIFAMILAPAIFFFYFVNYILPWLMIILGVLCMICGRSIRMRMISGFVAALPFIYYTASNFAYEFRKSTISKIERNDLRGSYPKTLIVSGGGINLAYIRWMKNFGFQRVYSMKIFDQSDQRTGTEYTLMHTSQCDELLAEIPPQSRRGSVKPTEMRLLERLEKECLSVRQVQFNNIDDVPDSVILLVAHETTLHEGNTLYAGGNMELHALREGETRFVDYWERTHRSIPQSPFCFAFGPGGCELKRYSRGETQISLDDFLKQNLLPAT